MQICVCLQDETIKCIFLHLIAHLCVSTNSIAVSTVAFATVFAVGNGVTACGASFGLNFDGQLPDRTRNGKFRKPAQRPESK